MNSMEVSQLLEALARIRQRRLLSYAPLATGVVMSIVYAFVESDGFKAAVGMLAITLAYLQSYSSKNFAKSTRCPRCNDLMFVRGHEYGFSLSQRHTQCAHCGLPLSARTEGEVLGSNISFKADRPDGPRP